MSTFIYLLSYLAHLFLRWEMYQTKVVEKFETSILRSTTIYRKSCRVWDNLEKYGTAGQATDEIPWRMRTACCIPKSTDTHSKYVILIAYSLQQWLHETRLNVMLYIHCLSYVTLFCERTDMIDVLENYRWPWVLFMDTGLLTMKFSEISYIRSYYR